ncbi:MAG: hypothetical protein MI861_27680, partial [Pirellulales bacterium]|nr:hypothetical protein [Pirellulales bacterium]
MVVTLEKLSAICSELKKTVPKTIPNAVPNAATEPLMKAAYNRVVIPGPDPKLQQADATLQEYQKDGKKHKEKYLENKDKSLEEWKQLGKDSLQPKPYNKDDLIEEPGLQRKQTAPDSDSDSEKQRTGTKYQQLAWKVYQNPSDALCVLGDTQHVLDYKEYFRLTDEQEKDVMQLQAAAMDALGIGRTRRRGDEFALDRTIDKQEEIDLKNLAKITSLVKAAKPSGTTFSEKTISRMQQDLDLLRKRLGKSLNEHNQRLDQQEKFYKDMQKLMTGNSRLQGVSNNSKKNSKLGSLDNGDDGIIRQTPLRQWHNSRVELKKLDSQIKILSGLEQLEVEAKVKEERDKIRNEVDRVKDQLQDQDVSDHIRQLTLSRLETYEQQRLDQTKRWEALVDQNLSRLCNQLKIDPANP